MIRSLIASSTLLLAAAAAHAQVGYTGGVYSQNFDTLPGTTNNVLNSAWTDNSTLTGWYASKSTFSITDGTLGGSASNFDSTSGSVNNVGMFSFGVAASTDRALGSRATSNFAGNDPVLYGVRLVNNTTQTLTRFTVIFTGEQWYASTQSAAHTLLLDYQVGATSISAGTWTNVSAGLFTAPISTGTTARSLNGNTAANRTNKIAVVTGVSWAPGQELWVRFRDTNESGNEQALSVDDFSFLADNETGLYFNGSASYVTMGFGTASATAFGASDFTLECRFLKTGSGTTASTGTGGVTAQPLIAKGVGEAENTTQDANYFMGIDANGKLVADFEQFNATNNGTAYAAGQNFPIMGSTTLQNGVWYHVAASYNTATAQWKLYVNGIEETTSVPAGSPAAFVGVIPRNDSIQGLGVGTTLNSTGARSGFFQGIIDEARIWNVVRTQSQIANNKDSKIVSGQTGMLARFGFDESTGTTAAGTTASGAATPAGTLSGSPLPAWVNAQTFTPNTPPTVAITAPANGASVMAPATIAITATASDTDGTVAKVEFYNGATKLGEDTTSPYQFDWSRSNAETGTFSLTAVATDNGGGVTTSTAISVTVAPNSNQPPVITLSSPADSATGIGSSTTISASIADPEGDAQTVTFYGRQTAPVAPGPDFTFVAIPDTQFYSENTGRNSSGGSSGAVISFFNAQTQWIVDNRVTKNIPFVSHMGDIVQNGDNSGNPAEWVRASTAMSTLESLPQTLQAYGIPWGAAPGNHDYGTGGGTGTTTFYNQYFGTSRFAGRNYYGGNYGTNNNNNYQLFSASGLDFIVIHFEYNAGAVSGYQAVLDWADALLKAYPNRRAIVTSHWIVNTGNPASFSTQGQAIYDNLKDNPNLFLMLCGHVNGEGRRSDVFAGRTVYSVLQDYQDITDGGKGFLRLYNFSPASNLITVESYSPVLGRAVQASDSVPSWTTTFTLPYNMQGAVTDWIPLGTANVAAGGTTASISWTGLQAGETYEWYATANDGVNLASSGTRRFSTAANAAPTVALTAPANNASFTAPASFNLTATAADADDGVARVEFYQGNTKLGEDTTAPYEQSVSGLLVGSYTFSAVAVDVSGQATLSSIVNVTVSASMAPVVSITAPAAGATFDAPATIQITADATDPDGTIALVEFFNGATKLGEDSTAPYSFDWTGVFTNSYSITAKATDNASTTTTSSAVAVTVTNADNVVPSVAITSPASSVTIAAGGSVTINASASDSDGQVTKVEFYQGATKLGEDTSAPYSYAWNNVASGTYAVTAVAIDNDNGSATSAAVTVISDASLWAYTQNFDSMASGTTPPAGWSFYGAMGNANTTWTDATGIPANSVGGGTVNNTLAAATTFTGTSNTAGYNFALPGSTSDRSLGTSPTTGQGVVLQLSLTNPTGAPLSSLRMGYDIRRFAAGGSTNELPGYWLFYSLDNGTTWTNVSALNPTITTVPNTVAVTTVAATTFGLSSPWAAGATLLFRWVDDNASQSSPDQVIGLDNVSITVPVGQPPTVALTSPANGSSAYVGETISLAATASDNDGTIAKVEFFQGSTEIGEDTSAPFTFDWSGFSAGSYSLTARATDNDGNVTSSSAVSVTVNAAPGSGTLMRGPYLNMSNQNSIVIRWRTSQSVVGRVRYGSSAASLTSSVDEASATTEHVVQLTGLSPYTRYYYSVGSAFDTVAGGVGDSNECTFRTSPVPGTATDTRIWVVGDCGRGTNNQKSARSAYYQWTGARTPDFVLMLGDNAYNSGTDAEYQSNYFAIYDTFFRKMPQWSCLGNHDANNGSTSSTANFPYFDMFTFPTNAECGGVASGTERYNSFDYGNVHVINLDSQTSSRAINGAMATWLQNDLASTTKTWIIAIFHHPPYSKGSHDSDSETQMVEMRTNFGPILENGGVDLVLVGHSHAYERSYFIDGHYGVSSTFNNSFKKQSGGGGASTGGAYIKPLTGPRDHFGTVYTVTGSAGETSGGSLNHAAMYVSYNTLGTFNIDINGNQMVATYIEPNAVTSEGAASTGVAKDTFTILKQGAADSDGDGVADEFEIANGMNRFSSADATGDPDKDGNDARTEYLLGLDPSKSDRYQWATTENPTTHQMDVTFPTLPQRTYQVYWSADLMTWFPASALVNGDGTSKVWTDDGSVTGSAPGVTGKRFYSVRVNNGP